MTRQEATLLAHARAYWTARRRRDGEAMARHLTGTLETLQKPDGEPVTTRSPVVEQH